MGPEPKPLHVRLLAGRMVDENGCWLWQKSKTPAGYGVMRLPGGRKKEGVHRVAYRIYVGPIHDGMMILHHCDVRHCFNPDHLYQGDARDNHRDALERGRWHNKNFQKEFCINGHNNWYVYDYRRTCKTCVLERGKS